MESRRSKIPLFVFFKNIELGHCFLQDQYLNYWECTAALENVMKIVIKRISFIFFLIQREWVSLFKDLATSFTKMIYCWKKCRKLVAEAIMGMFRPVSWLRAWNEHTVKRKYFDQVLNKEFNDLLFAIKAFITFAKNKEFRSFIY